MLLKLTAMGLVLAGMLVTATATRADDAAIAKDLKALEGEWTVKSEAGGGGKLSGDGAIVIVSMPLGVEELTA